MHTNTTVALKSNFMCSLFHGLYFFINTFSSISLEILQNFIITWAPLQICRKYFVLTSETMPKFTNRFAFHIFGLKCFILYTMLKLSKTTYPQNMFPSDCITLYECLLNLMINCTRRKHGRVVVFHSDDVDPDP